MPGTTQTRKTLSKNADIGANVVDRKDIKDGPVTVAEGLPVDGGGDPAAAAAVGNDDDDAIAAFFQEMRVDDAAKTHVIRKVSFSGGQRLFRLGPDYIDEEYFECTPIPLYQQPVPILDYDQFLEKSPDDILNITPIRPQTFSALFAFYRDRGPAFNWDPQLTDLEEDCFFQEVVNFPTSKLAYALPRERKRDAVKKKRVKVFKPNGDFVIKTRLNINLQESPTIILLELVSTLVLEADEKFPLTKEKNEKYLLMVKHRLESDSYASDYAQSFENYKLNKYSDYKIRGCLDVGTDCHHYFIEDEYRKVDADDVKRKIRETDELTARTLAEKARLDIPESGWKSSDSEDSSDQEEDLMNFRVDISRYKEDEEEDNRQNILEDASEDEIPMSEDDEEFEINFPLKNVYERKKHQAKLKGPRIYPDVSFSMIALERIICMDSQQHKQADMRGFIEPEVVKIEIPVEEEDAEKPEEMDEDTMVDLLIQQHRMEEHMEQMEAEGGDQDAIILPPEVTEAELLKIQAELGDDSVGDTGEGEEEKVELPVIKLESVKILEPQVEEEPEERDEFDLAIDGTLVDRNDEGQDSDGRKGLDRGEGREDDGVQDSVKDRWDDGSMLTDRYDKLSGMDSQGVQRVSMSAGGEEGVILGKINCEWDESAEREAETKEELEVEKANAEVVDDEKIELPQASEEDDEQTVPHKESHTHEKEKKEIIAELGYQFSELIPVETADLEKTDANKLVEEEEKDDISDESTAEEDSRLSDHKGLEELTSDSSDASEHYIPNFKELVAKRSSAGKIFGLTREAAIAQLDEDDQSSTGPNLKQYWQFKTQQTAGKEVTDIALHPNNGNIMAVSYGSFQFGKNAEEGLVCIWNAKNNRSPERTYHLKSPATTVAFSEFTPYVLAVGMLDGNLALYDVRESDSVVLGSTFLQEDKHIGPIWEIYWLVEVDSSNDESISEAMLSLGDDGYLKKWSMTKGLESSMVMKVMRSTMQVPGRREKRSESLITTLSTAYTVCFFPENPDYFLLGTEEGFIHKCATAYKDQYVSTYVGHTGPVYRISFSAFDESVFVSCGGDWTVKIWKTDFPAPLLSMQTGHRTIFDVTCSLYSSTVFISCTEFFIEVWDLSLNTLEPVVQYKPPYGVALRKAAFNGMLNSAIIGDDEGGLSIFGLRGFPKPPSTKVYQNEALLEALMPGYKRRLKDGIATTELVQAPDSVRNLAAKSNLSFKPSVKILEDDGRQKSLKNKV